MKYIIEFEDEPCMREDGLNFYKCIQAPWYQLSYSVIKRLTPYEPERKKGKWEPFDFPWFRCSECGAERENEIFMENFCPNCGADMRKENES